MTQVLTSGQLRGYQGRSLSIRSAPGGCLSICGRSLRSHCTAAGRSFRTTIQRQPPGAERAPGTPNQISPRRLDLIAASCGGKLATS
jgi:hypothetical protein